MTYINLKNCNVEFCIYKDDNSEELKYSRKEKDNSSENKKPVKSKSSSTNIITIGILILLFFVVGAIIVLVFENRLPATVLVTMVDQLISRIP